MSARIFNSDELNRIEINDIVIQLETIGILLKREGQRILIPWEDLAELLREIELRKKLLRGILSDDLTERMGDDF